MIQQQFEQLKAIRKRFCGENLVFKQIPDESTQEKLVYGLFRDDGTLLGKSTCNSNRFKKQALDLEKMDKSTCNSGKYTEQAGYLEDIYICSKFQRKGYDSQLLEKTCEALWKIEKIDIVLERPGDTVVSDGFNRKEWYERHGFESCSPPLTYMIRRYK